MKENHDDFVNQRSMFLSLRKLMNAKHQAQLTEKKSGESQQFMSLGLDNAEGMVMDQGAETMTFGD